ncbi:hypothetical protein ACFRMN_28550 [Streptomyces sp. NPDC056835]|uniref:hypothetical protein n=1 Tax=Streptomyces sp. NPDC056835 TaxID=3345956 RepID=UPI0036C02249
MRLRSTLAAAVGALALLFSVPGPASAAEGEFTYVYTDIAGKPRVGGLVDPESLVCLTIPEAAGEYVPPAHTPRNHTTATALVFTGPDCDGDEYILRPGGSASERLKLRSVVFFERF